MEKLRLGIDVFARDLGDKVVSTHFTTEGTPAIEGFEIYGPETYQLHNNHLYLCLDGAFPPCKHIQYGTGMIVNGAHVCEDIHCSRCDVITVQDMSSRKLVNEVGTIMERYNNLERALMVSADDAHLDTFMQDAEMLVGCPICILDTNLDVIAASSGKRVFGNPLWETIFRDEKNVRCEIIDHLFDERQSNGKAMTDDVQCISLVGWRMLMRNIVRKGHPVASLWAFQTKPHRAFGKAEKDLFLWLSGCVESWIGRSSLIKAARGKQTERFLLDLIDGVWNDNADIAYAADAIGIPDVAFGEHILMVTRFAFGMPHAGDCLKVLEELEEAVPGSICAASESAIVALVGADGDGYISKSRIKSINKICKYRGCITFIGTPYENLKDTPAVLRQLTSCFDLLGDLSDQCGAYEYCDYILQQTMRLIVSLQPKETLLHPIIRKIIAYDKANHTDYIDTFKVYLNNRCNMTDTAKQLHMHRNTLLHRIKRIETLVESEIDDWQTRRRLLLSLDYLNLDDPERF